MASLFYLDPSSGIFRSVKPGDNAVSPSSPKNVLFDAFGAKIHGVSISGIVPWSSFSGPTAFSTNNAQVQSAYYYSYQVNFAQPLSYIPWYVCTYQNVSGVWSTSYNSGIVSYYNSGGIMLPQGTSATAGAVATTTGLMLYYAIENYVNPDSYTTPSAFSYRLFGV
jgi:hypothetical protein